MKHRVATREDLMQWFGRVPASMRALVMEDDGELLGIAGIAVMGDHIQAFSIQSDKLRDHKIAKGRMAVAFAKMLADVKGPVFALCSETEPTAPGLLAHIGFVPHSKRMWRYG